MFRILLILVLCVTATSFSNGQKDPGPPQWHSWCWWSVPRFELQRTNSVLEWEAEFSEVDSVSGTIAGENGKGLGPAFNGNSCAQCHAEPAAGGSSPGLSSPQSNTKSAGHPGQSRWC